MDGCLYNRDPYRQVSTGYYAPSYVLERRSLYGLPPSDYIASYARVPVPIDAYTGYGAPAYYQPEVFRPRYASSAHRPAFRSRPRPGPKKKPAQNLGPFKKPFKQTQKVSFFEENGRSSKRSIQKKPLQAAKGVDKPDNKSGKAPKSQASSLAKETQELHSLYRTGVDTNTGKKFEEFARKKDDGRATSIKRKAETQKQKSSPVKEVLERAKKKQKRKKNKKFAKDKKSKKLADSVSVVAKAERPPLTEEEKKDAEAALELQRGMCESVAEFLCVPPAMEKPENKEALDASESDAKPDDTKEAEKPSKPEGPQRTPEEEKEVEEKSFQFFSKMFEEHQDLRNLYIDKCNSGSFECMVCCSIDAESSKKFWNLVSLVMHTNMRKHMQPEHRGYGRAVSAVLGWDPQRTPNVPRVNKDTPTDKPTDQGKDIIIPDADDKTFITDKKATDVNASSELQEENAAEDPSKDSLEE